MKAPVQTEIQKKREVWWKEHYKPGMTVSEVWKLNDELIHLYPPTKEEREEKWRSLKGMPEFVWKD